MKTARFPVLNVRVARHAAGLKTSVQGVVIVNAVSKQNVSVVQHVKLPSVGVVSNARDQIAESTV